LRAQLNRARNKGVVVSEWEADRIRGSEGLRECRDEWLRTRGLPPMHFLNESDVLDAPEGRRVFVMECGGRVVGFVVLAPIRARRGWLTELFVRGDHAPNGAVELGLHFAVKTVADEGAELLTMGMVPLSTRASQAENPAWFRALAGWARAHGRRFYNFDGLESFKAKFKPDSWEPIYAVSNQPRFGLRMLLAVLGAFTRVHPVWALALGVGRAVAQEAKWLVRGR
jgi:phosphatidylglycerol lysyltransferase